MVSANSQNKNKGGIFIALFDFKDFNFDNSTAKSGRHTKLVNENNLSTAQHWRANRNVPNWNIQIKNTARGTRGHLARRARELQQRVCEAGVRAVVCGSVGVSGGGRVTRRTLRMAALVGVDARGAGPATLRLGEQHLLDKYTYMYKKYDVRSTGCTGRKYHL